MDLSVIIPAYNESKRLKKTLEEALSFFSDKFENFEIILVDDGSTDETLISINSYRSNPNLRIITYSENRGKGYAIKQGVLAARGEIVLFMDADGATPISEFNNLLTFLGENPVVIGSRYQKMSSIEIKQPFYRIIIGRIGNYLIQKSLLPGIEDTQCGFKMFKNDIAKELFEDLTIERFGFDIEILVKAHQKGYSIVEVPVSWHHQGSSRIRPIKDSFRTFKDFLKIKKRLQR
ncbi:glycosyltransferase family 2 protein [Patescibacteria group bacterium]|nr:glycosyltransferase family 2 protein [Patescibacteria group bacterium]